MQRAKGRIVGGAARLRARSVRRRSGRLLVVAASLLAVAVVVGAAGATVGTITEYSIPNGGFGITAGPDRSLWFTERDGNKIGRITTAGAISEYPLPSGRRDPWEIAAGPDGSLWFTEWFGNKIGRITTAGAISEYPLPTFGSHPAEIAAGPDGNLWFTEGYANKIGRITTAGAISEYSLPTGDEQLGIAPGPDGSLWFTEWAGNKIGRITTAGAISEYPLPTGSFHPFAIAAGPDGSLWFTEESGHKIGRITTAGAISEYPIPSGGHGVGIAAGPDGNVWFIEGDKIGVVTLPRSPGSYSFTCAGCGPPVQFTQGTCTSTSATTSVCPLSFSFPSRVWAMNGRVTEVSSGLSGSVTGTCSVSISGQGQATIVNGMGTVTGQLSVSVDCSFHMAFSDSSTLDGTVLAASSNTVDASGGTEDGTVNMTVVAGSGRFAGLVGSSSFSHHVHLPPVVVPWPPPRTTATANAARTATSVLPKPRSPQTWKVKLHKGRAGVAIAFPGHSLTEKTDIGLLAVTAANRSCTATAAFGGKTVKLGSATSDTHGAARITKKLRPLLHPGKWTISVKCGAASAKSNVTIR